MSIDRAEIDAGVEALTSSREPFLIGVRHHSPALAAAMPALLESVDPTTVFIELPADFQPWLKYLADPALTAPVALAGVHGDQLAFYPFADFSPELAAVRWSFACDIPVVAGDLPIGARSEHTISPSGSRGGTEAFTLHAPTGRDDEDPWDRLVEVNATDSSPEQLRRAALAYGWALRQQRGSVSASDHAREDYMRAGLDQLRGDEPSGTRIAAVVGSFHGAALLPGGPVSSEQPDVDPAVVTSLVSYAFPLLDARSGYPAGIRDPAFQQAVFEADRSADALTAAVRAQVVDVCRAIRADGHPAGPAEAREVVRLATDLARLRGLPAPGRGEVVEALQSVLAQGEPVGRGRVVARAMQSVLVGDRRGRLAPGTPRSGLAPAADDELAGLRLPHSATPTARELRLDPLRSDLDRRRAVALTRLDLLGITYSERRDTGVGRAGGDTLTTLVRVEWQPATEATLQAASVSGVTLQLAAAAVLRRRRARELAEDGPTLAEAAAGLTAAADADAGALIGERIADMQRAAVITVADAVLALSALARVRAGHSPGLVDPSAWIGELVAAGDNVQAAGVRAISGLIGSNDLADVRAVVALVRAVEAGGWSLRLDATLRALRHDGSPVMAAAALALLVVLGRTDEDAAATVVTSWLSGATTADGRTALLARLQGLCVVAGPLLDTGGRLLSGVADYVEDCPDDDFVTRLPSLRGGFDALSPADRDRLIETVGARAGFGPLALLTPLDPAAMIRCARADRAAVARLAELQLDAPPVVASSTTTAVAVSPVRPSGREGNDLTPADRWRLVLGREPERLTGRAGRLGTSLDDLYGRGQGEGSGTGLGDGTPGAPGVREWAAEIEALFGTDVREEVIATAAAAGRLDLLEQLRPGSARASTELLASMLNLAGGLPEARLARLRPLIARMIGDLTASLAVRMRPALTGINTPRPTRRRTNRLDLRATTRANLHTAHPQPDGSVMLVPERPLFRSRGARSVDWHLMIVTDVSGSMEASTVWAALISAVLAGVPALDVRFFTFATEVADLSEHAADPLALLLEVSVGGGTDIGHALRVVREEITVPSRTMVVVVSDFEEGGSLGNLLAEVRALLDSGVRLLGCASLDDVGAARYSVDVAERLVAAGMPVAALSPSRLATWVAEQIS